MSGVLKLQDGVIYGPIASRRLGRSMGINLMPTKYKLCSFNCVYCHYGLTDKLSIDMTPFLTDLPDVDRAVKEVATVLQSKEAFDYLTFSGNGEPTLHPQFQELVMEITRLRARHRPSVKLALLSNSTGLIYESVRGSISAIDMPVFKLDAGSEEKFQQINRPSKDIRYTEIVELLASLSGIVLQTVFLDGKPNNTSDSDVELYAEKVKYIKPHAAHIYSIDRPVPDTDIKRVSPDKLKQIARYVEKTSGVNVIPFFIE